jgi:hypothetical protein
VSYFAIYLAAAGIYPMISNIVALTGGNTEGAYKRSVVMAVSGDGTVIRACLTLDVSPMQVVISTGNISGAVSSNIYPAKSSVSAPSCHVVSLISL